MVGPSTCWIRASRCVSWFDLPVPGLPSLQFLKSRVLPVEPENVDVTVLPDRPHQMTAGVNHQAHRVIESTLSHRVVAAELSSEPGVSRAVVQWPEQLVVAAPKVRPDQHHIQFGKVDGLAGR